MIIIVIIAGIITGLSLAYLLTQCAYSSSNSYGESTGDFKNFTGGSPAMHYIDSKQLTYDEFKGE